LVADLRDKIRATLVRQEINDDIRIMDVDTGDTIAAFDQQLRGGPADTAC